VPDAPQLRVARRGALKFKVRAIDAAGNVDATPDKDRFRVVD
jgi:hypothetical protein